MARAEVRIGCSGWQYAHWRRRFYPADLAQDRWLEFYTQRFDTVELNGSFYRLPERATFAGWAERLPEGFSMAVKASRYLTHVKRLREPREPLERLWSRALALGPRLGPMLYQLPPRWHRDEGRLEAFLAALPRGRAQAIEFRDRTWYAPEVKAALDAAGVALCLHDMPGSATEPAPIGPLAYVRFHGAGRRYGGRYSSQLLSAWARRLAAWSAGGLPCHVYFNNDANGHAVRDAERLRTLVARAAVR
jgi:uncharacterized protein YecE (DUF72 family)